MHLSRETLVRIFGGKASVGEQDAAAEHLLECRPCLTQTAKVVDELTDREALVPPDHEGCQFVLRLLAKEDHRLIEVLRARGWSAGLKGRSPRERLHAIRTTQAFQTRGTFETLVQEAIRLSFTDPLEAEDVGKLALAVVELLDDTEFGPRQKNDLRCRAWSTIANSRRVATDWTAAATAMGAAKQCHDAGTCDPLIEAHFLSIEASLATDMGRLETALGLLERARAIYRAAESSLGLARINVQEASLLQVTKPDQAYHMAGEALLLIGGADPRLTMFAKSVRTEALLEMGQAREALRNHRDCLGLYEQFLEPRIQLRVRFLEARLLEAFAHIREAEKLYEEVAEGFWEAELYKDMFMTKIHIFAFHLGHGAAGKATRVCRESLEAMESGAVPAHAQMREVWARLLERVERRTVDVRLVRAVRRYLLRYWQIPAQTLSFLEEVPQPER